MKDTIVLYNPLPGTCKESQAGVPLSLLSVAAPLATLDYRIKILDANAEDTEDACIQKAIESLGGCICVGISCMTGPQIKGALNLARAVKQHVPEIPIVLGGWHPTIMPEETLKHELVDIVVIGRGDHSFKEVVDALRLGRTLSDIKGIAYKEDNRMIRTAPRIFEDIKNTYPIPYHLIDDIEKYIIHTWHGERVLGYVSSCGCPQRCTFCAENAMNSGRWTSLSSDRVVREIKDIVEKYHLDGIQFCDSNFFANQERVRQICQGLIDNHVRIKWGQANGSAKILLQFRPETWELMKESGCCEILVGVESGDDEILRFLKKQASVADYIRLKELSFKYGIRLWASLMLGVPYDLKNSRKALMREYKACLALVRKFYSIDREDSFAMFVYTPYPGTPLYDFSIANGLKPPDTLEGWSEFGLNTVRIPWLNKEHIRLVEFVMKYLFVHSKSIDRTAISFRELSLIKKIFLLMCHGLVSLRIQHNFFGLPYEYRLIKLAKSFFKRIKG